jgi:para-nitrobenzyl esterase
MLTRRWNDWPAPYWVAFGKIGDPNGEDRPEWPLHDPSAYRVITSLTPESLVCQTRKRRLDLWKKVFDKGH